MKIYSVGGAVRDMQLGLDPKDVDFVVVGSTAEEMLAAGFEQVGASFPVFLHPVTRDEYALARIEKKAGVGYHGFEVETAGVTLEEDLRRRDLTINSMAWDGDRLIDPFGGLRDLKAKVLRHTSEAFAEDPLRVLRLARFFARYSDFTVAGETMTLASQLVDAGELDALPDERFTAELAKVFTEKEPVRFFELLMELDAFRRVDFFKRLFGNASMTRIRAAVMTSNALFNVNDRLTVFLVLMAQRPLEVRLSSVEAKASERFAEFMAGEVNTGHGFVRWLEKCRAFSDDLTVFNLVGKVVLLAEKLRDPVPFRASLVHYAQRATAEVRSEQFPSVPVGPQLGEAIRAARVERLFQILA